MYNAARLSLALLRAPFSCRPVPNVSPNFFFARPLLILTLAGLQAPGRVPPHHALSADSEGEGQGEGEEKAVSTQGKPSHTPVPEPYSSSWYLKVITIGVSNLIPQTPLLVPPYFLAPLPQVEWRWAPYKNSGRTDGFQLSRWQRAVKDPQASKGGTRDSGLGSPNPTPILPSCNLPKLPLTILASM